MEKAPQITIINPKKEAILDINKQYIIKTEIEQTYPITHVDYFINNVFVGTAKKSPFHLSFTPKKLQILKENNSLKAVVYDSVLNKGNSSINFKIKN